MSPRTPRRCGGKKGQWPSPVEEQDFISPVTPDCESYFEYAADGAISAVSDPPKQRSAGMTIQRLGLALPLLDAGRKAAIDAVVSDLDVAEVHAILASWNTPDAQGRLPPFAGVAVHMIRRFMQPLP